MAWPIHALMQDADDLRRAILTPQEIEHVRPDRSPPEARPHIARIPIRIGARGERPTGIADRPNIALRLPPPPLLFV